MTFLTYLPNVFFFLMHERNIGVVEMKTLARSHMWRLGIDKEIDQAIIDALCRLMFSESIMR